MNAIHTAPVLGLLALVACGGGDDRDPGETPIRTADTSAGIATALASGAAELSPDEVEAGRLDSSWKRYVQVDPPAEDAAQGSGEDASTTRADSAASDTTREAGASAQSWEDISAEAVNEEPVGLPIHGDVEGPAVAKIQILLDQASFSPGVIDGRWGKNTEKAVYWFQKARGLNATGSVDRQTLAALAERAGARQIESRTLTEQDVSGPFETLPEDVYARAEQPCLCYESLREQLSEVFHSTPALLEQLNPGVDLDGVAAGTTLQVPAVDPFHTEELPDGKYTGGGEVARIVISDGGHYVHALNEQGDILYHFPSTLGSDYAPSPEGAFSVESITFDPTWHYKPDLLTGVDPSEEDAVLPEGPNNAVGVVWMQLSKPHYGIHGTSAPETIGYVTSHGCVRLTNWDAGFLGQRVPPGTPVEFRDVAGRG